MTYRLQIVGLSCARGDRPLFSALDSEARGGELLHVVGSNGSGKTTLLRTICGLSRPLEGEIRWQGEPIFSLGEEYRRHIAYVGHLDGVQGELTAVENLRSLQCASPVSAGGRDKLVDDVLERMGLATRRSLAAKVLSQGQKRRLALARLLVDPKPLWILDEPFTALDVKSARLINELLVEQLARGGTVVLSSHQGLEIPGKAVGTLNLDEVRGRTFDIADEKPARAYAAGRETA